MSKQPKLVWPEVIHRDQLAELTGITGQTLWNLSHSGIIPRLDKGIVDCEGALRGLFAHYKTGRYGVTDERAKAKERRDKAEAEMSEIEVREKLEELVEVEVLAKRMTRPLAAMKQLIMGSTQLTPEEKEELLTHLKELMGAAFNQPLKSPKLKQFVQRHKITLTKPDET